MFNDQLFRKRALIYIHLSISMMQIPLLLLIAEQLNLEFGKMYIISSHKSWLWHTTGFTEFTLLRLF